MAKDFGEGMGVKPKNTPEDAMSTEELHKRAEDERKKFDPVNIAKDLGVSLQRSVRSSFSGLPADFLVINDLVFSDIPATAISIENSADVSVIETLRTQTATAQPKGRGNGIVSIQLLFNHGRPQTDKLRRLMAELLHNPFTFIENNKIRQALYAPTIEDRQNGISINTETMAFVLHFGSLSISEQMPGVIVLDLQFAEFNYKPFSHHFWYGTLIHGIDVPPKPGEPKKEEEQRQQAKIFPYQAGYESYDFSEEAMRSASADAWEKMLAGTMKYGTINTPVVFPFQSKAYMYYVDGLLAKMPVLAEHHSDYIHFVYREYDVKTPPPGACTGTSSLEEFFGEMEYTSRPRTATKSKGGGGSGRSASSNVLKWESLARQEAAKYQSLGMTPGHILAIIERESKGDPNSVSKTGYRGLMQIGWEVCETWVVQGAGKGRPHPWPGNFTGNQKQKKAAAHKAGSTIVFDPALNIEIGTWNLAEAYKSAKRIGAGGDLWAWAEAIFGWGIGNVKTTVKEAKERLGHSPTLEEMQQLYPDAGGKNVRPWVRGMQYASGITRYNKKIGYTAPLGQGSGAPLVNTPPPAFKPADYSYSPYSDNVRTRSTAEKKPEDKTSEQNEEKSKKDMENREMKRAEWISGLEDDNWFLHDDPAFGNLFYRDVHLHVGGNYGAMLGIVPTAVSIQFGHRLAKHKILGHEAPTWQFLGAGNKSGTIVFTAAGEVGRYSLQQIKTMYRTLNHNARNISGIRESSSVRLYPFGNSKDEANNIFLLSKIEDIVITNINEESVIQDGVDVYRMTIEFVAQDFPEFDFVPRGTMSEKTKNSMMAKLISDLQYVDRSKKDIKEIGIDGTWDNIVQKFMIAVSHLHLLGLVLSDEATDADIIRGQALMTRAFLTKILEYKKENHYVVPSSSVAEWSDSDKKWIAKSPAPQWYVDILFDLSFKFKEMADRFPILDIPVEPAQIIETASNIELQKKELEKQRKSITWEEKLFNFGQELGGVGANLVTLIGGKGLDFGRTVLRGYNVPTTLGEGTSTALTYFNDLGAHVSSFVERAIRNIPDKAGFSAVFGGTAYEDIVASVMSDMGDCYKDLELPNIPGTNFQVVPEFYMYDDSMENASITQLTTGTGALQEAIKRHVENQIKSNQKFIYDGMMGEMGRAQVSYNSPLVAAIRRGYGNTLSGETRFMELGGLSNMPTSGDKNWAIQEALRTIDMTGYLLAEDELRTDQEWLTSNAAVWFNSPITEWKSKFSGYKLGEITIDKMTQAFLTAVVSSANLSEYNAGENSRGFTITQGLNDRASVYRNLREYFFNNERGKAPERILRGPSVLNTAVDSTWNGDVDANAVANLDEGESLPPSSNSLQPPAIQGEAKQISPEATVSLSPAEVQEMKKQVKEELTELAATQEAHTNYVNVKNFVDNTLPQMTAMAGGELPLAGAHIMGPTTDHYEQKLDYSKASLEKHLGKMFDLFKDAASMDKQAKRLVDECVRRVKKDISLRRAYPTFKIYFIDEDNEVEGLSGFHAFDDFYSYNAVQEIRITRSRKIAADLAVVRITDVAQKLTMTRFNNIEIEEGQLKGEDALSWKKETLKENPFNGAILQEGVKVQIRLGYSNNPDELESVFLGQVVEISPSDDGKILEIVCQGYGAELEAASMDNPEEELIYYSPQHALGAAIMQPCVRNFGHWSFNQTYNPAQIRNLYASGGESPFEVTFGLSILQDSLRELSFRLTRFQNFRNNPEDDNIFAPPPWTYADAWDRFWNNAVAFRPLMMTPWEVFKEHELRHPGYAALAVPYGHEPRMTMFFGARGQSYWAFPPSERELALSKYWTNLVLKFGGSRISQGANDDVLLYGLGLLKKKNPEFYRAFLRSLMPNNFQGMGFYLGGIHGRYRPFRNYHIFTSEHHIIQNEIRSSMANSFNTVEIRYADDEDFLNGNNTKEIANDVKKIQNGGGGIITVKLNDNLPENQVRTYEDSFPSCVTEFMARRYAQALLMEGVKSSYSGSLTVTGEETLKPFDIVMVRDHITDMYGPIEVEAVTHIFNRETGFVSVITPNLCVDANDWYGKGWMDTYCHVMSLVYEAAEQQKVMNTYRKNPISTGGTFDNFLSKIAAFQVIHWDQTASPMCCTPVMYKGRPLMSVTTAPKFAAWFTNIWGKWHQWWEDFYVGLELGGLSEEVELQKDDIFNTVMGLFDASQGGSRKEKEGG